MKTTLCTVAAAALLAATGASAQTVNLTGAYRCVEGCKAAPVGAPAFVGADSMVGAEGEAREELAPEGLVFVSGALWKAVAPEPIHAGSRVRVVGRDGLQLRVVAGENGANGTIKEKK